MKVLIIIPAYNESLSIVSVVEEVKSYGYDYLVINDGSTDDTLDVCIKNNIQVLNLVKNLGIGGAVQAGHKFAYENGYDVDIQFDGDGQHDALYLSKMLSQVEKGSDLVIGSRFLSSTDGFQSTFMRRVGIKWLSWLIYVLSKQKITDPTSGLRAANRKTIELFCKTYPIDYPEPESIVEALNANLSITEIPVKMRERSEGKSSIDIFSSVYYMIKVSLAIIIFSFGSKLDRKRVL